MDAFKGSAAEMAADADRTVPPQDATKPETPVSKPAPQPAQTTSSSSSSSPGSGPGPSPAATSAPSSARPAYLQQFSAVTQMILQRMKGEPHSLSATLSQASRSPSIGPTISPASYDDVKRRLVMSMNTSTQMTMQMPAPVPVRPPPSTVRVTVPRPTASTAGMSAIRKVTAGLTGLSKPAATKPLAPRVLSSESKIKKTKPLTGPRGSNGKRRRIKTEDNDDNELASNTSSLSSRSTPEVSPQPPPTERAAAAGATAPPTPTTVTKSGRQVLKPTAYNPAAMDAASRKARPNYGKRTAEQALCRKCSRMHSPTANQMVFCDGCNDGWHQLCHEPHIADAVVRDARQGWFCAACAARRPPAPAQKRVRVEGQQQQQHHPVRHRDKEREKESWAGRPPQQKRAYLLTLPQQELVGLLMSSLELHPDLPIFPAPALPDRPPPRSLFAGTTTEGLFPRVDANPLGQINFVRKIGSNGKNGASGKGRSAASGAKGSQKEGSQDRVKAEEDDEEFDQLVTLWPRPGTGLYTRLLPDTDDDERLKDDDDYEAFSVILYDERGRKVEENGMPV